MRTGLGSAVRICRGRAAVALVALLTLLGASPGVAQSALPDTVNLYFQTSGRERAATIGDWYTTTDTGEPSSSTSPCGAISSSLDTLKLHCFQVEVGADLLALNGGAVTVTVEDADANGLLDEVNGGRSDPSRFRLWDRVTGTLEQEVAFDQNAADGSQAVFTITAAGSYLLTAEVGAHRVPRANGRTTSNSDYNDDDNTYKILVGGDYPVVVGTYQSTLQASGSASFDVWFYVPEGTPGPLQLRNFDADNNASFSYLRPDGSSALGTTSGNGVWNGVGGSLNAGYDAVALAGTDGTPQYGWWRLRTTNLSGNNQVIFEFNDGNGARLPASFSRPADLAIAKTVDDAAPSVGADVTFTVTVTNSGGSGASGVEVTDLLPSGLDYVSHAISATGTSSYDDATGLWEIAAIPPGGSATLTLVATATQDAPVTNTATVTDATQPVARISASATVDAVVGGRLVVEKSVRNVSRGEVFGGAAGGSASPGETLEYRLVYRAEDNWVEDVVLIDQAPAFTDLLLDAYGGSTDARLTCPDGGSEDLDLGVATGFAVDVTATCGIARVQAGEGGELVFQVVVR